VISFQNSRQSARVSVHRLSLTNFRNYQSLTLDFDGRHIVFYGNNGAGKTSILEAMSLLSAGRGLKRAPYSDMIFRLQQETGFAVYAKLQSSLYGEVAIGTGLNEGDINRKIRINGVSKTADDMAEYCRMIWLIPAMDGLFTGPTADRRRFLDRMVLAVDPSHAGRVARYDKAMRSRNRLLIDGSVDRNFFAALESQMAELGTAIAAARADLVALLTRVIYYLAEQTPFPKASLELDGSLEQALQSKAALDVEEDFRAQLEFNREQDRLAGRTLHGPHRTDVLVNHHGKNIAAYLCSTGEQKALLMGLILAHGELTAEVSGMTPVILLDEMAAHLDQRRRSALFDVLDAIGVQAVLTGTDRQLFDDLGGRGQFFEIYESKVTSV